MMRKASVKDVDEQRGRASSIADSKSGARVAQLSNMNPSNPAMIINPLDQKQHTLKRKLRHKVSADRHRFQDGRYDIDLSYITPRLMAMAFPGEGMEKTWRNNINTVASFFQEYHKGAFMVWNLTEKGYDYSKFGNNVRHLGFPDHHPPPIDLLFKIVHSLDEWLSSDGIRVAAIHCLGGKGRTGVVIACYLMFSGMFPHISEALNYFAEKRSAISNGVRQPSQLRYVYYFEKTLRSGLRPFPRMVTLKKIEISPVPNVEWGGCRPVLKIYSSHKYPKVCIFSEVGRDYDLKNQTGILFDFTVDGSRGIPIQGDIMIQLSHKTSFKKVLLFQCSFHTFFLDYSVMTLPVEELDGTKKSIKFFDEHCTVSLHFGGSKGVPQTHIGRGKNAMELQKDPSLDRIYKSIFNRSSVPVQKCQKSGKLIRATKRENSRYDVPIDFIQAKWSDSDSSESSDSDSDSEEKEGETTQNKRSLYKKKKEKRKKKDFYDGKNSGVGLSLSCSPVGRSSPSKTQSSEPGIQWRHRPTINGRQNLKFSEKSLTMIGFRKGTASFDNENEVMSLSPSSPNKVETGSPCPSSPSRPSSPQISRVSPSLTPLTLAASLPNTPRSSSPSPSLEGSRSPVSPTSLTLHSPSSPSPPSPSSPCPSPSPPHIIAVLPLTISITPPSSPPPSSRSSSPGRSRSLSPASFRGRSRSLTPSPSSSPSPSPPQSRFRCGTPTSPSSPSRVSLRCSIASSRRSYSAGSRTPSPTQEHAMEHLPFTATPSFHTFSTLPAPASPPLRASALTTAEEEGQPHKHLVRSYSSSSMSFSQPPLESVEKESGSSHQANDGEWGSSSFGGNEATSVKIGCSRLTKRGLAPRRLRVKDKETFSQHPRQPQERQQQPQKAQETKALPTGRPPKKMTPQHSPKGKSPGQKNFTKSPRSTDTSSFSSQTSIETPSEII